MTTLSEALAPRSDQLNADDLIPGPRVLKITGARISTEDRQKRMSLSYEGDNGKPFKPCKTMGRAMVMVWAITDEGYEQQLIGKSIRVYRDPEVRFGDQGQVGGIRISHMSHIEKPVSVKLTVSQGKKSVFTFHPLATGVSGKAATPHPAADAMIALIEAQASVPDLVKLVKAETATIDTWPEDVANRVWDVAAAHKTALTARSKRAAFDDGAEGPSDDQRGESHTDAATATKAQTITDDIVTRARNATTAAALDDVAGDLRAERDTMTPAQVEECEVAISDARAALN